MAAYNVQYMAIIYILCDLEFSDSQFVELQYNYKNPCITFTPCNTYTRVRNPKNQLSQINSLTTVGCSLEYPIAKSTMKLEVRLLSSQNYALLLWTRRTIYF